MQAAVALLFADKIEIDALTKKIALHPLSHTLRISPKSKNTFALLQIQTITNEVHKVYAVPSLGGVIIFFKCYCSTC